MMRPVTRTFSANDREKDDSTNERYRPYAGCDSKIELIFVMDINEITRGALVCEDFNSS